MIRWVRLFDCMCQSSVHIVTFKRNDKTPPNSPMELESKTPDSPPAEKTVERIKVR